MAEKSVAFSLFFDCPPLVFIYTINAIERLKVSIGMTTKTHRSFTVDESATKSLDPASDAGKIDDTAPRPGAIQLQFVILSRRTVST